MTHQSHSWAYIQKKSHNSKRHMHPSVHCSTVYKVKVQKKPKCPLAKE